MSTNDNNDHLNYFYLSESRVSRLSLNTFQISCSVEQQFILSQQRFIKDMSTNFYRFFFFTYNMDTIQIEDINNERETKNK